MIAGALAFYQFHSWRNRLATRLRRLRQPKYLAGAIVGSLYFYFYAFHGFRPAQHGVGPAAKLSLPPGMNDLPQTLGAVVVMIVLLLAWILPHSRAALAFTESEIAFLFPAPVSRKSLIHFKLLRSQTTILFSALIVTLIRRAWVGGPFLTRALGFWAGMSVFNLHLLGSSFALTMLMDRGYSTWKRRALVLGMVAAVAAALLIWVRHSLPPFPDVSQQDGLEWLFIYIGQVFESGPLPWLLAPFKMVVAPYFAANYHQFLVAIGPALCIIGLHYVWVMRCNVAFEEASVELSRRMAERVAAVRAGNWRGTRRPKKASRSPFVLRPAGQPAVAVLWKNLISAGQYVTARVWFILVWVAVVAGMFLQSRSARGGGGLGVAVMFFLGMLLAMSLFSGPQMLRNDLRQDLPVADVLKMFPMHGWQIVLGEVLTPAAILAGLQWLVLLFAVIFCPAHLEKLTISPAWRWSAALALAVVLPFIDLIALLIPNAAVLFFPAWFQLGKETTRGFETMGQQLILMFGQLLVLVLGLLPAGLVFALLFMGGSFVQWPHVGLVVGALAAAAILAVEAGLGIKLLGRVFEKLDVSGEVL